MHRSIKLPSNPTHLINFLAGEFSKNKMHGKGTFSGADGTLYVGSYENGEKSGKGILKYKDGGKYTGEFKADQQHGQGKFTGVSDGQKEDYDGEWRSGLKHGNGVRNFGSGNRYEGEWANDLMHGHGIFTGVDGHRYIIGWRTTSMRRAASDTVLVWAGTVAGSRRELCTAEASTNRKMEGDMRESSLVTVETGLAFRNTPMGHFTTAAGRTISGTAKARSQALRTASAFRMLVRGRPGSEMAPGSLSL